MSSDSTWYLKQVTTQVEEYIRKLLDCTNIYDAFADPLNFLLNVREIISKQIKFNNLELLIQCIDVLYKAQSIMGNSRAYLMSFVLESILSCLSLAEIQDLAGTLLTELSQDTSILSVLKLAIVFYLQLNADNYSLVEYASSLFFNIFYSYPNTEFNKLLENYSSSNIFPNSNNHSISRRHSMVSQIANTIDVLYYIPEVFLNSWKVPKSDEEHCLVLKAITNQYQYCKDIKNKISNMHIDLDVKTILNQLLKDLINTNSILVINTVLDFLEILLIDSPYYFYDHYKDLFSRLQELMGNTRSQTYLPAIHFSYSLAYHLPYTVTCPVLFSRLSNPMDKASLLQVNMQVVALSLLSSSTEVSITEISNFCGIAAKYLLNADPCILSKCSKAQNSKEENVLGNGLIVDSAADLLAVCLFCWHILQKSPSRCHADSNSFPYDFSVIVNASIHPSIASEICERSFSLTLPSLLSHPYAASLLAQRVGSGSGIYDLPITTTAANKYIPSANYSSQYNDNINNNGSAIQSATNAVINTSTESRIYSRMTKKDPPESTSFPPLKIITDFQSSTPTTEKRNPIFDSTSTYQPSWASQGIGSGSSATSIFPGSPWVIRDASKEVDRSKLSSIKKMGRPPQSASNYSIKLLKDDEVDDDQIIDEETVWSTNNNSSSSSYPTRKGLPQTSLGLRSVPKDISTSSLMLEELQDNGGGSRGGIGMEQSCPSTSAGISSVKAALAMGPQTPMEVGLYNSEGVRVQRLRRGGRLRASRAANATQLDGLTMPKESDSEQEGNNTSPIFDTATRTRNYTSDSISTGLGMPLLDTALPLRFGKGGVKQAFSIETSQNYDTSSFQDNTINDEKEAITTPSSRKLISVSHIRSGRRLVIGSDTSDVERPPERESVSQSIGTRLHYGNTMYSSTPSAIGRSRGMSSDENNEQEVDSELDISLSVYESDDDAFSGTESIKSSRTGRGTAKSRRRRGGASRIGTSILTRSNEGQESDDDDDDDDSNVNKPTGTRHSNLKGKDPTVENSVSSSLQNQDAVVYLPSSEICPSLNPSQELNRVLLELETSAWPEIFQTLTSVRRLGLHHQSTIRSSGSLHAIVKGTLKQTENLRSAVTKNALLAIGDLFEGMGKDMDAEVTVATPILVKRCADSSIFLSESAVQAVYQMIEGVSASRALTALLSCGDHRNAVVRSKVAEMLLKLVIGKGSNLKGTRELQSLFVRLAKLISDPTPEARAASREIVRRLLRHDIVSRGELEKHITADMIDKCLKEETTHKNAVIAAEAVGRPRGSSNSGAITASAAPSTGKTTARPPRREVTAKGNLQQEGNDDANSFIGGIGSDGRQDGSLPFSQRSPTLDANPLNPHNPSPKQRHTGRNATTATATAAVSNTKTDTKKAQETTDLLVLPSLLSSLLTSHWSERKSGVENLTEFIIENSQLLRKSSKLEGAMEALLTKVDDGSVKVSIQAVLCLQKLQERTPLIIPSMLPLAFPWLLCAASASNKEVCGIATTLLWSVLEACSMDVVLKQLSSTALHDRDRLKAVSLKLLGQFSVKHLSTQPAILKRDVFPTLCRTLCTTSGVKADVRAAAIESLRTVQSCTSEAIWKWTEIALQKDELRRILGS